jgi:hypothetical protein
MGTVAPGSELMGWELGGGSGGRCVGFGTCADNHPAPAQTITIPSLLARDIGFVRHDIPLLYASFSPKGECLQNQPDTARGLRAS